MHHDVSRFTQLATRVWGCKMNESNPEETAKEGIRKFEEFLQSIEMPISFKEIDAKEEDIPVMIEKIMLYSPTVGKFIVLDNTDMENVYRLAL